MKKNEKKLLKKARDIYKKIFPCGARVSFAECFTTYNNRLFLWFDTEDRSTHILVDNCVNEK